MRVGRPRSETLVAPFRKEPDVASSPPLPPAEVRLRIRSSTDVAPERAIDSRVITVIGEIPSASMRLILEPVISTRCTLGTGASIASCACTLIVATPANAANANLTTCTLFFSRNIITYSFS